MSILTTGLLLINVNVSFKSNVLVKVEFTFKESRTLLLKKTVLVVV